MRPAADQASSSFLTDARSSAVDLSELRRLGGEAFQEDALAVQRELIELFLRHAPHSYALAKAAFADGDSQSVGRVAHKLKTQAAYFGAARVVQVCKELERLGYAGNLTRCARLLDDLEDELDRVFLALEPYRAQNA
jgi:HPt (histidine-containing phosphotransfer) domain-containing protein